MNKVEVEVEVDMQWITWFFLFYFAVSFREFFHSGKIFDLPNKKLKVLVTAV